MEVKQFMVKIGQYYGAYNNGQDEMIYEYLVANYLEKDLDELFASVLWTFSSRWGKPPGIAEFEIEAEKQREKNRWFGLETFKETGEMFLFGKPKQKRIT